MSPEENTRLYRIEQAISQMRLDVAKVLQRLDREVDPDSDDHEARLRKIESKVHAALGAVALMSAIGAWTWIASLLR